VPSVNYGNKHKYVDIYKSFDSSVVVLKESILNSRCVVKKENEGC